MKSLIFGYLLANVLYIVRGELYQFRGFVTYPPGIYQYREPENSNWKVDKYEVQRVRDENVYSVNQSAATWISEPLLKSENLPKQIDDHRNLSKLIITETVPSDKIPPNLFYHFDELKEFYIWSTDLESLVEENFENANHLNILLLNNNKLQKLQSNVFRQVRNLEDIDLSVNKIETLDVDVFNSDSLKHINLSFNKLRYLKPEWFESSKLKNLKTLQLGMNLIEEIDFSIFFESNRFVNLKHLSVEYNKLKVVKNCIKNEPSKLELFRISNNPSIDTQDANAIFVNAHEVHIRNINATQCKIGSNVEDFSAHNNKIDNVIVAAFPNVTSKLISLSLSHNKLTNFSILATFPNLQRLDLSHNFIQTFDMETLSNLKELKTIDFFHNKIKSVDFGLIDSLQNLELLILSQNKISNFRLDRLLPALKFVYLRTNSLTEIDLSLKAKAPKLENLLLDDNNWNCDVLNKIVGTFARDGIYLYDRVEFRDEFWGENGETVPINDIVTMIGCYSGGPSGGPIWAK